MRAAVFLLTLTIASGSATAATFIVNTTADTNDVAPGDGVCADAASFCSLRAAVEETNALAGRDRIDVPSGTYVSATYLNVLDLLDVVGAGESTVVGMWVIVGRNLTTPQLGALDVSAVAFTGSVETYSPLTMRNCIAPDVKASDYFYGYAVMFRAFSSRLKNISAGRSVVSLSDSVLENGTVDLADSNLFVERSTFVDTRVVTSHKTTASRNDAMFINTTFTGAGTTIGGTELINVYTFNYCTFADGARITTPGYAIIGNTILRNVNGQPNCSSTAFRSFGNNISSDESCASWFTAAGDRNGVDPLLAPLTTDTSGKPVYPLLAGSPATDAAGAPVATDERGIGRPQGAASDVGAYEACATCVPGARIVQGDFNRDGRGDILWRYKPNNVLAVWLMNGTTLLEGTYLQPAPAGAFTGDDDDPSFPGSLFAADIDGDGDADIDGGRLRFMEGTRFRYFPQLRCRDVYIASRCGTGALAFADFDGDGKPDFLWRDVDSGALHVYLVAGAFHYGRRAAVPAAEWAFVAARDFDGDGRADIIWRNTTTNEVVLWRMREWWIEGTVYVASPPPEWELLAAGDFDGNGRSDLLWRNVNTYDIAEWTFTASGALETALIIARTPLPWHVRAVAKLNDDATDDLVWRHEGEGDNAAWLMAPAGGILEASYLLDVPSLDWEIVAPK